MNYPPSLTIAIVTYFSDLKILKELLLSLNSELDNLRSSLKSCKVFIIDNSVYPKNSSLSDDYRLNLRSLTLQTLSHPTELIFNSRNLGFAKGHNKILNKLRVGELNTKYHLVLNPDIILQENALKICLNFMESNTHVGCVTPNSINRYGKKEYLCKRYPRLFDLIIRGIGNELLMNVFNHRLGIYEMRDLIGDKIFCDVSITSGCFMFLRVDAIRDIGVFDERFFLYFEDFDYSLRLSEKWKICYHPDVKIVHFGGFTGKKGIKHIYLFLKSLIKFYSKHGWEIL